MTRTRQVVTLLLQNPVALKELRSRMRGRRAFVVLTIYVSLLSILVTLVYFSYVTRAQISASAIASLTDVGRSVFATVLSVQAFLVLFIGPVFTTGAITGERERQTFALLRTTLLSTPAFLLGKLISGLAYILLLILASIPLQSMAFLLGGVALSDLVLTQAVILICAVTFAAMGLLYSSLMRSTLAATVLTLCTVLLFLVGIPLLFVLADLFGIPYYRLLPYNGDRLLAMTNVAGCLVNIMNPHSSFGQAAPTLAFVGLYAGIAAALFALSVRRLNRIAAV